MIARLFRHLTDHGNPLVFLQRQESAVVFQQHHALPGNFTRQRVMFFRIVGFVAKRLFALLGEVYQAVNHLIEKIL